MLLQGPEVLAVLANKGGDGISRVKGSPHLENWVEGRLGKALTAKLLSLDLIH